MTAMSAITVLDGDAEVRAAVGRDLGTTGWMVVTPERIADFVAATGDGVTPGDATYLAICLSNRFLPEIVEVRGFAMGINVGTDAVRFGPPLTAGQRVRATASLVAVAEVRGGIQTRMRIVVEAGRDGGDDADVGGATESWCEIESLSRWM